MKKTIGSIIALLLCALHVQGQQQVVSSAGNFHSNASGSVSWTLGELAIETLTTANNVLTQGFQQSRLTVTGFGDLPILDYEIVVFPNPASDHIIIRTDKEQHENLHYQLYDLSGRIILQNKILETETTIPVNHLRSAVYLLRIIEGNRQVRAFKVVKQ
jgi:hypothetical protein